MPEATQQQKEKQVTFHIEDHNKSYERISEENSEDKSLGSKKAQKLRQKEMQQQQESLASIEEASRPAERPCTKAIFYNPEVEFLSVYEGEVDCCDRLLSGVRLVSSHTFGQLSQMPASQCEYVKIAHTVHFHKLRDYINHLAKVGGSQQAVITCGWVECESSKDSLENFAAKLQRSVKAGVIEWSDQCKIYVFHRDDLSDKWHRKLFYGSDFTYRYPSSVLWISIYKKKSDAPSTQLLVPNILPRSAAMQGGQPKPQIRKCSEQISLEVEPDTTTEMPALHAEAQAQLSDPASNQNVPSMLEALIQPEQNQEKIQQINSYVQGSLACPPRRAFDNSNRAPKRFFDRQCDRFGNGFRSVQKPSTATPNWNTNYRKFSTAKFPAAHQGNASWRGPGVYGHSAQAGAFHAQSSNTGYRASSPNPRGNGFHQPNPGQFTGRQRPFFSVSK